MKYICILFLILLTSCSFLKPKTVIEDLGTFHPARPVPISMISPEWKLVTPTTHNSIIKQGDAYSYMCLTWEDYLVLGQNMQSIKKYLKDDNALLCYYRKDLKEVECIPYLPEEKK